MCSRSNKRRSFVAFFRWICATSSFVPGGGKEESFGNHYHHHHHRRRRRHSSCFILVTLHFLGAAFFLFLFLKKWERCTRTYEYFLLLRDVRTILTRSGGPLAPIRSFRARASEYENLADLTTISGQPVVATLFNCRLALARLGAAITPSSVTSFFLTLLLFILKKNQALARE